jgi:hypothetical protein
MSGDFFLSIKMLKRRERKKRKERNLSPAIYFGFLKSWAGKSAQFR